MILNKKNKKSKKKKRNKKKKKILKSKVLRGPGAKPCGSLFGGACNTFLTPESDSPRKNASDHLWAEL